MIFNLVKQFDLRQSTNKILTLFTLQPNPIVQCALVISGQRVAQKPNVIRANRLSSIRRYLYSPNAKARHRKRRITHNRSQASLRDSNKWLPKNRAALKSFSEKLQVVSAARINDATAFSRLCHAHGKYGLRRSAQLRS